MATKITVIVKNRYKTALELTTQNPILLAGEIGIESDIQKMKIGDGVTTWNLLPYFGGGGGGSVGSEWQSGIEYNTGNQVFYAGTFWTSDDDSNEGNIPGVTGWTEIPTYEFQQINGNAATATNADKLDNLDSTSFLRSDTENDYIDITNLEAGSTVTYASGRLAFDASQGFIAARSQTYGDETTDNVFYTILDGGNIVSGTAITITNPGPNATGTLPYTFDVDLGTGSTQAAFGDHNHDVAYLGITSQASDSDKLDNLHATDFVRTGNNNSGIIYSTNDIIAGQGSGSIAMTINDGYGNSNLTFNHASGTPDQNGNAMRLECNTDATSDAKMDIELKSNVTSGTPVTLTAVASFTETSISLKQPTTVTGDFTVTGVLDAPHDHDGEYYKIVPDKTNPIKGNMYIGPGTVELNVDGVSWIDMYPQGGSDHDHDGEYVKLVMSKSNPVKGNLYIGPGAIEICVDGVTWVTIFP